MGITKQSLLEAEALEIYLDGEDGEMIDSDEFDWLREEMTQSWPPDQDLITSRQPN